MEDRRAGVDSTCRRRLVTAEQLRATVDAHRRVAARHRAWSRGSRAATPIRGTTSRRSWRSRSADGSAEAERGFDWLRSHPAARRRRGTSTTWPTGSSRTSSTPTASPTSPPASGTTGCCTDDRGFLETMWPIVDAGHRVRARPADRPAARSSGPATPTARRGRFALLTGSSSICHSLRCAIADRRGSSATSDPTGSSPPPASPASSATSPTRSPRSTAGRWTGTTRC